MRYEIWDMGYGIWDWNGDYDKWDRINGIRVGWDMDSPNPIYMGGKYTVTPAALHSG
uniref:Uncharacterized protein n=1 Tax=Rhizophagus irregularis (strain DAOM 181602 / DAOM 197198 / MUCL 43194) TaxID=747089 RepID=U9SNY4_RHIID